MHTGRVVQALKHGAGWWTTLLVGAAIALPVSLAETTIWRTLDAHTGPIAAALIILVASVILALTAAVFLGRIRVPGKMAMYRLTYPLRMAPWKVRELLAGGHPGNGRRNRRYSTEAAFIADDPRRRPGYTGGGDQYDYGVHWRDRQGGGHRLTWIKDTRELVAVAPGGRRAEEGTVEIIARIPSQAETEHRLYNWPYAHNDLRWVRRRAHGWNVPLPPRGKYWLNEDTKPPTPWPTPPTPSVDRREGAYVGTTGDLDHTITVTDAEGTRPLYHHVRHSPTGYSWGYGGDGPHDLARSILYDRLGYVPSPYIYSQFCADVISGLPPDFTLTYKQVDTWIKNHGKLFARSPQAEPFDPYALGGA